MAEELSEERREQMRQQFLKIFLEVYDTTPYFKNLPCKILSIEKGLSKVDFEITENLCNYRGIASGGILAAFCDTLMGMASRSLGFMVTTLEINMNYIRRVALGEHITGIGRVIHHGGRIIVVECECLNSKGKIVVKGRASFYVLGKATIN